MHPIYSFVFCLCLYRSGGKCIEAASTHMSLTNTFFHYPSRYTTFLTFLLVVYTLSHQLVRLNAWYRMCTADTLPALVAIGPGTWKIN